MNIPELIAAAGIASTVTFAGVSAYDRAADDARTSAQHHAAAALDDAVATAYRGQSLHSLTPEIARLLAPDVPTRNGWGGVTRVEQLSETDPRDGYRIADPVPARACVGYVMRLARGFDRVEVDGVIVSIGRRAEIDAQALEGACKGGGATVEIALVRYV